MTQMRKNDPGSIVVIIITFILFVAAVFFKGVTHDLLLEAGVFLVSVKLIIMAYKNGTAFESVQRQLDEIKSLLTKQHK
ncbi:hypothetical protein KP001_09835 [Geomonas subterranea]|uniref:Uncharacterized protein n=2 Tax=Geomonas subterranea TaxID=2847989 RepID=A0ABX8LTH2_9BACT|nr:hypothetical protein [Geomonas subterranea]QXE92790.1 hypothetical protein KP001_09835 [Geomonas subterranea]